jgi:hypothetical protein
MPSEVPPEGWLVKVWTATSSVDLIHTVTGYESVEEILRRSEVMRVASLDVPVAQMEDVLTPKLLSFDEHYLDYTGTAAGRPRPARADRLGAARRAYRRVPVRPWVHRAVPRARGRSAGERAGRRAGPEHPRLHGLTPPYGGPRRV